MTLSTPVTTAYVTPNTVALANPQQHDLQGDDDTNCCIGIDGNEADDLWGDTIVSKPPTTLRFAVQNIQGLPISPYTDKHRQITSVIDSLQLDSFGLIEINLNFPRLPSSLQWKERFKDLLHKNTTCSTNIHSNTTDRTLFGGTAQLTQGTLAHRAISTGKDVSGLGRWVWTRFIGKNGTHLRFITGYRPVSANNSDGPFQVANQHETYFLTHDDDRPARCAFFDDLDAEISDWLTQGDTLILSLDANEFVRSNEINRYIRKWGLIDAHYYRHPNLPTVATCSKNRHNTPIDGIWVSASIDIRACGYTGFGEYPIGLTDHRLLWIDVSTTSCLGLTPPPPVYQPPRRLTVNDPRTINRYNKILKQEHQRLRLPQRAVTLHNHLPCFTTENQREYESLAKLDLQCRRHAERKCRKLRMGAIPFSDDLKKADNQVQLWLLLRKKRQGHRASVKKIRRLMRQCQEPLAFTLALPALDTALTKARQQYKQVKRNATELRRKFRQRLHRAKAQVKGISTASQEAMSHHIEQQRLIARRVRSITGKAQERCSFKLLDAPSQGRHRQLCTSRKEIEAACMNEGLRRFTQACDTPFLQSPLLDDIGLLATSPAADAILNGTYMIPASTDIMTRKFIYQLRRDPDVPDLPTGYINSSENTAGWKKVKARTSASPDGPGFVDYIAGSKDPAISAFDSIMSSIPFCTGYAPDSWSSATDVLIPKKADTIEVEKLRIIILYHALFNQANKSIGRSLLSHAEKYDQIPWEVYGSRRHHRSIECAINKVLTTDLWRQSRRSGALCSNDAQSCYDRIIHNVATLAMRRLGLSPETCHVMFGTLEQVRHHVRTAYGDSAASYRGIEIPLQGIGQGNGAGPAIWLVVSIVIIKMLKAEGFGLKMRTPMSHDPFDFVCYTFVDDTDLVHSPSEHTPWEVILTEMQQVIDHWDGGLHASGGALVPAKSYWYLISFKWYKDNWFYHTIAETPGALSMFDQTRQQVPLTRLEASDARETLGIYLSMDGNQQLEFTKLQEIANRWSDQVRCGRLSTAEAWFSLNHTVMKSLEYPLMATRLSFSQCDSIMTTLLKAALPKLHIAMAFPKLARFGPRRYHGLGIPHLWTTQGIEKIWAILRHGDDKTIPGYQLRCSLELHQLELGIPGQLFSYCYKDIGHLATPSWITSLWEFISARGFSLSDPQPKLPIICQNDQFLTDALIALRPNKTDLRLANLCRQWLRLLRLSDMSTGDGTSILDCYWNGTTQCIINLDYDWPRAEKPSASAWRAWRHLLSHIAPGAHHRFNTPLGAWHTPPTDSDAWFYSEHENRLVHRQDSIYQIYTAATGRSTRRSRFQASPTTMDGINSTYARTTTLAYGTHVKHTGTRPSVDTPPQPTVNIINDHWSTERLSVPHNFDNIADAIRLGSAFALCDGSYKSKHGTAAFVIQNSSQTSGRIIGCHRTPGHPSEQDSFRSEVGGILAIVLLTNQLCQHYAISSGTMELACDCQSALTVIFVHEWDTPTQASYDLIHAARKAILCSPITWRWRHVKGHQDRHTTLDQLDWRSQLNVEIDSLAKAYWNETYASHQPFYDTSDGSWHFGFGNRQFSHLDRKLVYESCHGPPLRDYWSQKKNLSATDIQSINWEVCEDALRRLGLFRRIWLAKMNTDTAPTGKILHRRGHQDNPNCPRCGSYEDIEHVFRCPQPDATIVWHKSVVVLDLWLRQQSTRPDLHAAMLQGLQSWHSDPLIPSPCPLQPDIAQCILAQTSIGWQSFLLGFATTHWAELQQAYFANLGSRRTGFRWARDLFSKAVSISWNMWRHRCDVQQQPDSLFQMDEHRRINALIQEEYDRGTLGWRHRDRRWFNRSASSIFEEALTYKSEWLQSVTIARERHARRQQTPHEQEQRTLRQFLLPLSPN